MQNKNKLTICILLNLLLFAIIVTAQGTTPLANFVNREAQPQPTQTSKSEIPLEFLTQQSPTKEIPQLKSLIPEGTPSEKLKLIKEIKPQLNLNWIYISAPIFLVVVFLTFLEIHRKIGHRELMNQRRQYNIASLRNYAMTNLRRGFKKEQIRNALIKNNYKNEEIEEAFKGLR